MKAPTIKNAPGTDAARKSGEFLREVWAPELRRGFLLTIRQAPDASDPKGARLVIEVHGADAGVFVRLNGRDYKPAR